MNSNLRMDSAYERRIEYITKLNGPVSSFAEPLLKFFADTNKKVYSIDGAPVQDALAVTASIWPDIVKTRFLDCSNRTIG